MDIQISAEIEPARNWRKSNRTNRWWARQQAHGWRVAKYVVAIIFKKTGPSDQDLNLRMMVHLNSHFDRGLFTVSDLKNHVRITLS